MKEKENQVGINEVTKNVNESLAINTMDNSVSERYTSNDLREEEMQEFLRAISIALLSYSHKMKEENKNV